jgi:hypothetical protein
MADERAPSAATEPAAAPVESPSAQVAYRPAPGRPAPAPVPATSPRARLRIPLFVRLAVTVIAGAVAAAILGARPESVVAIVSWMLIAAGAIQLLSVLIDLFAD